MYKKNYTKKSYSEKKTDYEQQITDIFIEGIKNNNVPWTKSWTAVELKSNEDFNMRTMVDKDGNKNNCYNGMNSLLTMIVRLGVFKSEDPRWMTFVDMNKMNEKIKDEKERIWVKAGEKALPLRHFEFRYYDHNNKIIDTTKPYDKKDVAKVVPISSPFYVFHASQFGKKTYDEQGNAIKDSDGKFVYRPAFEEYKINKKEEETKESTFKEIERAQEILDYSGAKIYHDQIDRCYNNGDEIHMVPRDNFKSEIYYYNTILHELTHWTGDEKRLNRECYAKYGDSKNYRAKEELVAEIGSFILAKESGYSFEPQDDTLAYVQSWSRALKNQDDESVKKDVYESVTNAWKAKDFIIKVVKENKKEKTEKKEIEQTINNEITEEKSNKGKKR